MSVITEVAYQYIIDRLNTRSIRHDVHYFDSGAKMIDIWYNGHFYVIQMNSESIGFSEITEANPGFDTIPDESFYTSEKAQRHFESLLS
ncbi:hypothetical protein SAMN05216167_14623 [Spirosoma endophyticum]|uniref:Uncharacterized protein n=1 Tax=Spirosoma endophyticum TaxID=662367 RepID=A0A1I2HRY3_9BACT|nr:hypothetical protein SAMN05216167_14623 [Spirosoma endophyticum]